MEKKGHIFFVIIGILVVVFLGFIYYFKNSINQERASEQERSEPVNSGEFFKETGENEQGLEGEKEIYDSKNKFLGQLSNEEIKKLFNATEVIINDSPKVIEFWTEATCPGDGLDSDYSFEKIGLTFEAGYFLISCVHGDDEFHNYKTIKIRLGNEGFFLDNDLMEAELNSLENIKINDSFAFAQGYSTRYPGGWGSGYSIFYKGNESGLSCTDIDKSLGVYDINFDGYDDIICFDHYMSGYGNVGIYDVKINKFIDDHTVCNDAGINEQGNLSCSWWKDEGVSKYLITGKSIYSINNDNKLTLIKKYTLRGYNNPRYDCERFEELINGEWVRKNIRTDYKSGIKTEEDCVYRE
ncbi:MAG: hypothetical protein MNSN_05100 [Minisyncoccus archaeiphilus]|uniref:hypothetical protein n=1 Tax=Minisyncoccus archaeiphilus TaxID=3238481 RepID=UPI002B1B885B|nr:MAG: hypothetical protein MNSN_05100 [Candidatus Parcubacteria bacterium]